MDTTLSPAWGPYLNGPDAGIHLGGFVDTVCGPEVGIVWAANGNLYPLRAPRRDGSGNGEVLVFEWNGPPSLARPPTGFWNQVTQFINDALAAEGRAELEQAAVQRAMGVAMLQVLSKSSRTHQDDGIGVLLDVVGIALSIALIPTGVGVIATAALLGSVFLLATDSYAYALEMDRNDSGAEAFKKRTERYRIVATVMTLPDAVYGGFKAVRELQEIRELRALDRITAISAQGMEVRTANANRAARFKQVAERANLRTIADTADQRIAHARDRTTQYRSWLSRIARA